MHEISPYKEGESVYEQGPYTVPPSPNVLKFCIRLAGLALASGGAARSLIPRSGLLQLCPHLSWDYAVYILNKLSMIVLNKRSYQWPNSSKKDVSLIPIPTNGAQPKQYSSPSLTYF